jgi:pSer/pThr/pTyr-binding forkhead associated (FHA) protein
MEERLTYLYHVQSGRPYLLKEGARLTIGRAFDNDVMVDDESVSRHHAYLTIAGGQIRVTDLDSTNGTFVNGRRVIATYALPLLTSDEIQVGETMFRIYDGDKVIKTNFETNRIPLRTAVRSSSRD